VSQVSTRPRLDPDKFLWELRRRGKQPSDLTEVGFSAPTVTKLGRGEEVAQATINRLAEQLAQWPVDPAIEALLPDRLEASA
jgi:hypothetical protein